MLLCSSPVLIKNSLSTKCVHFVKEKRELQLTSTWKERQLQVYPCARYRFLKRLKNLVTGHIQKTGTHRRAEILGFPPLGRTASIVTIKYVCTEGEVGQDTPRDNSQSQNSSDLWRIRCLSRVDAEDRGSALPLSLAREAGVLPFH